MPKCLLDVLWKMSLVRQKKRAFKEVRVLSVCKAGQVPTDELIKQPPAEAGCEERRSVKKPEC